MKDTKRALRRHHYARLKANKQKLIDSQYWFDGIDDIKAKQTMICIMVNTPKQQSSCLCCGNPRKHLQEITLQEERNLLSFNEFMKELY